jgi:hypothetical protein
MREYREIVEAETTTKLAASENRQPKIPGYMSLASQYGLGDEMQIGGSSVSSQATIEQEYSAYTTASLSETTVDIIKFWEVSLWMVDSCGMKIRYETH